MDGFVHTIKIPNVNHMLIRIKVFTIIIILPLTQNFSPHGAASLWTCHDKRKIVMYVSGRKRIPKLRGMGRRITQKRDALANDRNREDDQFLCLNYPDKSQG